MFGELQIPLPGDVLFYTSGKAHGAAIEAKQRSLGFENPQLMHAALMVDNRVLVEATTKDGVSFKPIFHDLSTFKKHRPAIVLRGKRLADSPSCSFEIWRHAFYFQGQKYDWVGALQRHRLDSKRKICSTLVQQILSRISALSEVRLTSGDYQVFPAELHNILLGLGFEKAKQYTDPSEADLVARNDLLMEGVLGARRETQLTKEKFQDFVVDQSTLLGLPEFSKSYGDAAEEVIALISCAFHFGNSQMSLTTNLIQNLSRAISVLEERMDDPALSWTDEQHRSSSSTKMASKIRSVHDHLCLHIDMLCHITEEIVPEFLRISRRDKVERDIEFEKIFQIRLLDAGSKHEEMNVTAEYLLRSYTELLHRIEHCSAISEKERFRDSFGKFRTILIGLISDLAGYLDTEPSNYAVTLSNVNELVDQLTGLVQSILQASSDGPIGLDTPSPI